MRGKVRALVAGLVLVVAACTPPVTPGQPSPTTTTTTRTTSSSVPSPLSGRPNIILFLTDDQSSNQMTALPSVTQLIQARGTTFANAIVPIPLCCPARAALLTGQYDHNNGVVSNHNGPNGGYDGLDQTNTLAKWLHDVGYRTAHVGKYMNGYSPSRARPVGWDEWWAASTNAFLVYDYTLDHNGTEVHYGFAPSDYKTDVFTGIADSFVQSALSGSEPFYLQVWYTTPHVEIGTDSTGHVFSGSAPRPAPRHVGLYSTEPFPRGDPSFNEADVSDKPAFVRALPSITASHTASMAAKFRTQLAALASVDEGIRKIVDTVTAAGELTNTVFVFTSDNGDMHGEHRIPSGKQIAYEPSLRVPLFISGPGFPAGTVVTSPVMFPDYAPTILDLTGATPSVLMDGTPLQTAIATRPADRAILIDSGLDTSADQRFEGVRTSRWMYASYSNTGDEELYDLVHDPYELESQAKNPVYAAHLAAARQLVTALRGCKATACDVDIPAVLG
jgi:arylsulfatase A-like enzyme